MEKKVKVAIDASGVIDLFTLIHPKNDIDGKIMTALSQGTLDARDWENVERENKPRLLQDKILGYVKDNKYFNLENTYILLQLILQDKVEICITPTTLIALTGLNNLELDFLQNHITTLSISSANSGKVYEQIYNLAMLYKKLYNEVGPTQKTSELTVHKAIVVAEASMAGLPLITSDKSLVHFTNKRQYEMANFIRQVNRDFKDVDLSVKNMANKLMSPSTITIATFVKNMEDERFYLYPDSDSLRIKDNQIDFSL